jgi:diguanylate cyclase (GGDEF)-like protein/PAS domain S-box-containing protein
MKLLLKLASIIIVIMLLTTLVIFYVTWTSSAKTLNAQARDSLEEQASHIMDKVDRMLFERKGDLEVIASDPIITSRESSPRQITERLITYRNIYKTYASLSFFDLNRVSIADTSGLGLGKQESVFKEWDAVLQGKLSVAADIAISKMLGMPVIYFATLVKDKYSQAFGVIMSRMPLDQLYNILGNVSITSQLEEAMSVELVNRDGVIIYSNFNRKGMLIEKSPHWEAVKNRSQENIGTIENYGHPGEEDSLLVFCREQGYLNFIGNGWTLMINVPTRIIFAPLTELRNSWILVMLPSIILSIIVTLFFSFSLSKPLTELRDAVSEVGKGNLNTRVKIKSRDEIGDLADYFNKMVDNLKRTTTSIDNLEREITERKQLTKKLEHSSSQNKLILDSAGEGILGIDIQGNHTFVNLAATKMLGYEVDELIGKHSHSAWHYKKPDGSPYPKEECPIYKALKDGTTHRIYNEVFWKKDGTNFPVEYTSTPIQEEGKIVGTVVVFNDITERKQVQHKLEEMATHDYLTGLPNRVLLIDRFTVAAALARRNKTRLAVMSLDLDKFKSINDTLGHDIGDRVLRAVGNRLTGALRASDTIARVGGDEFILVMLETNQREDTTVIAQKILDAFIEPLSIDGHQLNLSTSIGIAIYPEDAEDMETLIKKSDAAMYYSKGHGRNKFKFFSDGDVLIGGDYKSATLI